MEFSCSVSLGEVLDKISILRIKLDRIKDAAKVAHIRTELDRLVAQLGDAATYEPYIAELTVHNTVIWDVEDVLRLKEKNQIFDAEFIQMARRAYMTNDKRFGVKDAANKKFNSAIREQKSYEQY
jgi:hypothetical protein